MGRIHELDAATANGIAAGEVVERPSSVVKELVENAIDAGATVITVEISGGGISLIRITDDGCGMDEEDARLAFLCHATSKLNTLDDLFSLHSMGFRGEALSSIAAASRVNLKTKQPGAETGTEVVLEAGQTLRVIPTGGPSGTRIEVRDLFFNLPARYKFLKKDQTESQYITTLCERFALIRPDISFRLISQGKELLHTPGNNDAKSSLYSIYGKQIVDQCIPIEDTYGQLTISGFAGKPEIARSSRGEQIIFVNDRLIRSKVISSAIDEAYKTMLMKGRHAFLILSIRISSNLVDVNVHPQKAEVRFWNDSEVFRAVYHVLQNALLSATHIVEPQMLFGTPGKQQYELSDIKVTAESTGETISASDDKNKDRDQGALPPAAVTKQTPDAYPAQPGLQTVTEGSPSAYTFEISDGVPFETPFGNTPENSAEQSFSVEQNVSSKPGPYGFSITDLLGARIIGVAFATYILLEMDKHLVLLDQHAAHEKILFEKLVKEHENRKDRGVRSQPLLAPEIISLTASDMLFLEEMSEYMSKAGFLFEPMGDNEVILREVPAVSMDINPENAFRITLENVKREIPQTDEALLLLLATSACKAAVKGHDRLDGLEIKALLADLSKLNNPYHCPHGRPIIIRLSQKDLEKEFKRIV